MGGHGPRTHEGTTRDNADGARKFRRQANLHRVPARAASAGHGGLRARTARTSRSCCAAATTRSSAWSARPTSARARRRRARSAGDLLDPPTLRAAVEAVAPDELYHLAAPTFVPDSWEDPTETVAAIAGATATLLAAARDVDPAMRVWVVDLERGLRRRGREPADRAQPDAPALALRRGEARRARPRGSDARALRALRVLGHHLQPRVAAAARALPPAQGHARRGRDQARPRARARARRPRRGARLVARRRRRARARGWRCRPTSPATTSSRRASGAPCAISSTAFAAVDLRGAARARRPGLRARARADAAVGDPTRARERLGWAPERFEELVAEMVAGRPRALRR